MNFESQEEAKNYGIENLLTFGKALVELADVGSDVLEDGKFTFDDAVHALRLADLFNNLKTAPQAVKELLDLDEAEYTQLRNEIRAFAAEKAEDLGSDKLEEIAKNIVEAAGSLVLAVNSFLK